MLYLIKNYEIKNKFIQYFLNKITNKFYVFINNDLIIKDYIKNIYSFSYENDIFEIKNNVFYFNKIKLKPCNYLIKTFLYSTKTNSYKINMIYNYFDETMSIKVNDFLIFNNLEHGRIFEKNTQIINFENQKLSFKKSKINNEINTIVLIANTRKEQLSLEDTNIEKCFTELKKDVKNLNYLSYLKVNVFSTSLLSLLLFAILDLQVFFVFNVKLSSWYLYLFANISFLLMSIFIILLTKFFSFTKTIKKYK